MWSPTDLAAKRASPVDTKLNFQHLKVRQKNRLEQKNTTPLYDPNHSLVGTPTPVTDGSLTVVKPYITNTYLNQKFGFGWNKNPDTAYQAGLALGIQARPGEDTYSLVNRIHLELSKNKRNYA